MIKVCIDPGHGGSDRANRGSNGYVEADGVLAISKYLKEELESTGKFQVILTRDRDMTLSLTERGRIAARNKVDLFISQHTNAGPKGAGGTEVYYSVDIPGDRELAAKLSAEVASVLGIKDRGIKTRESTITRGEDYYTVIDAAQDGGVPHVLLIESAFHSNPDEERLLMKDENLRKIAQAQAKVISGFFGVDYNRRGSGEDSKKKEEPEPVKAPGKSNVMVLQLLVNSLGIRDMDGRKLIVDGMIGPRTRYAVQRLPVTSINSRNRQTTLYIQNRLNQLGFKDNAGRALVVDGVFGPKTEQAVKKFQSANGLVADGIVGPKTWMKFLEQ